MKRQGKYRCLAGLLLIGLLFLFSGCSKKNQSFNLRPNLNAADDIVIAERGLAHTFNLLLRANLDSMIMNTGHGIIDQAIVAYLKPENTFNILYSGKRCADSAVRNGLISIRLSGNFFTKGTVSRVTFKGYSEDYHLFTGSDSLVNQGSSPAGFLVMASFIDSLIIYKDSTGNIYWYSSLVYNIPPMIKLPPDSNTPVNITGSAHGISSHSYNYSLQITSPLINDLNCPWFRDGIMQVSISGVDVPSGTIRFMNRTKCDNRVTYDFEGNLFEWWINARKLGV